MTRIRFNNGATLTIDSRGVTSDDKWLQKAFTMPIIMAVNPRFASPAEPDPALAAALYIIKTLGDGTIEHHDKLRPLPPEVQFNLVLLNSTKPKG